MRSRQDSPEELKERVNSYLELNEEICIEHCIFSWTIDNFKCKEVKNCKYACSPKFSIGSSYFSTWRIMFRCGILLNDVPGIEFRLHRLDNISGPDDTCLAFKFGLKNSAGNKVWFEDILEKSFKKFHVFGFCTSVLDQLEHFYDGSLTILCEIYAFATNTVDSTCAYYRDKHQIGLSKDLAKMFYLSEPHDALLKAFNGTYWVHKSILLARSTVFARMLQHLNTYIEIQALSDSNANNLLSFMYSGNLAFAMKMAFTNMGLYEAAYNLDISGLAKHLTPTFVTIKSSPDRDESDFTWRIENFSVRRSSNDVIVSPEFSGNLSRAIGWSIKLCNLCSSSIDSIALFVKPRWHRGDIELFLEVSLLDRNQRPWMKKSMNGLLLPGMLYGFSSFVEKSAFDKWPDVLLPHDTLTLQCKLSFTEEFNGTYYSSFACSSYGELSNVQLLQKDLLEIYRSGELTDFELSTNERTFRVHKPILAARTAFFADPQRQYLTTFQVSNMAPDVLEKVLTYVYSGVLNDFTVQLAKDMYIAAREFGMPLLKKECISYLYRSIEMPVVVDVFCFARRFFETDLKESCLSYMHDNADELFARKEWLDLEKQYPQLKFQILRARV